MLARHRIEHLTPLLKMKTIHHNLLPDFKKDRGKAGTAGARGKAFFIVKSKSTAAERQFLEERAPASS